MGKRSLEYGHRMVENRAYVYFQSQGHILTFTLNAERAIVPAVHALDWIFQSNGEETQLQVVEVIRDPDLESKIKGQGARFGVPLEIHTSGGYNFILVPEGEAAKIGAVLAAYMGLLKKPGYNGRPNLLVKEIPADEKVRVMEIGRRNGINAVVADDGTFICLRGSSFRGGLQERLGSSGYRLANLDTAFVF